MTIHKKSILLGVVMLLAATIWVVSAGNLIDQNGVLAGRVVSQNLVKAGTTVKEGTILVTVESITGAAVQELRALDAEIWRDGVIQAAVAMPAIKRFGSVRMTPSSEPRINATIQATTAIAMVQPRPEINQSRYVSLPTPVDLKNTLQSQL